MTAQARLDYEELDDVALARLVAARDPEAVRLVTQRNNQRLYRAAWSILGNRADAEDAVQSAYLAAFAAIEGFEGRSSLSTWLTRIAINEALGRQRSARRRRQQLDGASVTVLDDYREKLMRGSISGTSPDGELARAQVRSLLEKAIAGLPAEFRLVFVLREIEGLSVEQTADALGLVPGTVKTRHLRARRRLQQALAPEVQAVLTGAFPFAGLDCEAMTERVVAAFCTAAA
ncbi:MAG TPA: RNA polymerase sigma factor [Allosphingosinicella sp.]|nr:RNA polymerase sigma factor [Allosphingosinicella sp.]